MASIIALMAWIYTYLFPGSYGVLDVVNFTNPGRLNVFVQGFTRADIILSGLEAIILGIALIWAIRKLAENPPLGVTLLLILNLISAAQTFIPLAATEGIRKASTGVSGLLPDNRDKIFRLSAQENRLVFMFDMFGADLIPSILEDYPEIKEGLDGFIWFPNTLTTGVATYGSMPSILAGPEFTPYRVNHGNFQSLDAMYREAYMNYPEFCRDQGYEMSLVDPVFFTPEVLAEQGDVNVAQSVNYMEYWLNQSEEAAKFDLSLSASDYTRIFSAIGLFKAMPHFMRPFIYLDGRWLMLARGNMLLKHAATYLGFLTLIDDFLHVDEGEKVFKFINNKVTHNPWNINEELLLDDSIETSFIEDPQYKVYKPGNDSYYYTAVRTLMEMVGILKRLEELGVKDQTRIILVSDHGYNGIHRQWTENPIIYNNLGSPVRGASRVNSLLLVKDFNSSGPIQIDSRLMSISDVPSLIEAQENWSEQILPNHQEVTVSFTHSREETHGPENYKIQQFYRVTGDPSKKENWHWATP